MKKLVCKMLVPVLWAVPMCAQAGADPCATAPQSCATLINTQASAESRIANTVADVSVGITASGRDLAAVQRTLAEKTSQLLTYLRSARAERLMTTSVSFSPQTKTQKNALDRTVGYDGSSQVSFRIAQERAPEVLAGVLDHGANNIDSTNFTPTEAEVAAARASLSAEATKTAIAQAEAIARAAGMHVAAVRTINVDAADGVRPRAGMMAPMMMKAAAASAPIETAAGDQSLSVRVQVTVAAAR